MEKLEREKISGNIALVEPLVLSSADLNLNAHRILRLCMNMIGAGDNEDKIYSFTLNEYKDIFGLNANIHTKVSEALNQLRNNTINLAEKYGAIASCFRYARLLNGKVEVIFDKELMRLCKNNIVCRYNLESICKLHSTYSIRFYELMLLKSKREAAKSHFTVNVKWLRDWLGLNEKYKNYADLRNRIINQVINEISNAPDTKMRIRYSEIKEGLKIEKIKFIIEKVY